MYNLLDDPELNESKLKQSHQPLMGKLAVFDKFAGEIFKLFGKDELADEIDLGNSFKEKLQLAIIDIDQALKGDLNPVGRCALEDECSIITTPRTDPSLLTITTTIPFSMECTNSLQVKLPKLTLK